MLERSVRHFLCARCRDPVLLCSHCDRGQRYCGQACSSQTRCERRRETNRRYQNTPGGRLKHAARSARWRERQRARQRDDASSEIEKVTYQGCGDAVADAPLLPCETPSTCETVVHTESAPGTAPAACAAAPFVAPVAWVCRRCAHPVLPHVRQGWLRTRSDRWRNAHDHWP